MEKGIIVGVNTIDDSRLFLEEIEELKNLCFACEIEVLDVVTQNEMILQSADELVNIVTNIIENKNKDIDYIDGANHQYNGKEKELAEQIIEFIKSNK